jgi:hypothetical protein
MNASSQQTAKRHTKAILIPSEVVSIVRFARYPAYRIRYPAINLKILPLHDSGRTMLFSLRY